jgi:hypothetical protein
MVNGTDILEDFAATFINAADEMSAIIIIFFVVLYLDPEHSSPLHNIHEEPMSSD